MRLKMRFVLFGLLLLVGQDMRADCMPRHNSNIRYLSGFYSSRPVLWFSFNYYKETDIPVFRYGRPYLYCGNDTIPLQVIDSIINKRNQQWLLRPVRDMQHDSVYHAISFDTITFDLELQLQYDLLAGPGWMIYPKTGRIDTEPPRLTGEIKILEIGDSADRNCGGYTGVTLLIPRSDTMQWIVKGIFTETETGKQVVGYGVCNDSLVYFGRSSCDEELLLDGRKKYTLKLELIDLNNNRTTVRFPGIIDFYPATKSGGNNLWIWVAGSLVLLALAATWFLLKRRRRQSS
jgi:hypothetical protein